MNGASLVVKPDLVSTREPILISSLTVYTTLSVVLQWGDCVVEWEIDYRSRRDRRF